MTLTRRKKKFAECIFRTPHRDTVLKKMNMTEGNFNALFSDPEVIAYLEILYKRSNRIATATSYGALLTNISELNGVVSDPTVSEKTRVAAAKELRETHIQLQEHEVNARIIAELDEISSL